MELADCRGEGDSNVSYMHGCGLLGCCLARSINQVHYSVMHRNKLLLALVLRLGSELSV